MPTPASTPGMTLGRSVIDVSAMSSLDDVIAAIGQIQMAVGGAGFYGPARKGDTVYRGVYEMGGDLYLGTPSDPTNPVLYATAAGGTINVQDETVDIGAPVGTLNFTGAAVVATLNGAVADITIAGGTSDSFKTIACPLGTNPVADSATDTLTLNSDLLITISGNEIGDSITIGAAFTMFRALVNGAVASTDVSGLFDNGTQILGSPPVSGTFYNMHSKAYVDNEEILIIGDGTPTYAGLKLGTESFTTFAVSGQSNVVADSYADTMTFVAGTGMGITTNAGTDTITFTPTPYTAGTNIDITGFVISATGLAASPDICSGVIGFELTQDKSYSDTDKLAKPLDSTGTIDSGAADIYVLDANGNFYGLADTGPDRGYHGHALFVQSDYLGSGLDAYRIIDMEGPAHLITGELAGGYGAATSFTPSAVQIWGRPDRGRRLPSTGDITVYDDDLVAEDALVGQQWLVAWNEAEEHYTFVCPTKGEQQTIWGLDPAGGHSITTTGTTLTLTLKVKKYDFLAMNFVSADAQDIEIEYEGTACP